MNRLVYLFELDSVRVGRVDAETAEFAVFNEIIKNGNKVVMSMSQFVDSRLMTAAMYDEDSYKFVTRLFDAGALMVSLYADVCSVSQYVQNAIDKCLSKSRSGYIFNSLPIKADDSEMLREIKNSLQYSDISRVSKMLDDEYVKLRYELSSAAKDAILENIRKLKITIRFLSLVLRLSVNAKSNNPPKPVEGRSLLDFINEARVILKNGSFRRRDINVHKENVLLKLDCALRRFEMEGLSKKQINRRTLWLKQLGAEKKTDTATRLAVEIVNICYNYAVQDTILGVSKQYDDENFKESFRYDFVRRVNRHWVMRSRAARIRSAEEEAEYRFLYPKLWKRAERICGYNSDIRTLELLTPDDNPKERKSWYSLILKNLGVTLGFTALYTLAFCIIGLAVDLLIVSSDASIMGFLFSNVGSVILVIALSVVLSLLTNFPSALECAAALVRHTSNIVNAAFRKYDLRAKR